MKSLLHGMPVSICRLTVPLLCTLVVVMTGCDKKPTDPAGNNISGKIKQPGGPSQSATYDVLVSALEATGLDQTLAGTGPFTLLAASDDAFGALNQEALDALNQNPELLKSLLEYHVLSGSFPSDQLRQQTAAATLLGVDVKVSTSGADLKLDDATVTTADIQATNGLIHLIDRVLVPYVTPPIPGQPGTVTAATILADPAAFDNKRVALVGRVIRQIDDDDFEFDDGTALIRIDKGDSSDPSPPLNLTLEIAGIVKAGSSGSVTQVLLLAFRQQ